MLAMKPNCMCCDRDISHGDPAFICSFECTFCPDCTNGRLGGVCPNCNGNLTPRPTRADNYKAKYPPMTARAPTSAACR